MTDRELLELAAKAAGVCLHPADKLEHSYGNWGCDTRCTVCKEDPSRAYWNPLANDGDALRLAVKLKLTIGFEFDRVFAIGDDDKIASEYLYDKPVPTDPYAATRRAIVRAAAEIGKNL